MKRTLWVPLDVNFWLDPKVLACSFGAQILFVRSLCLAKQTASNGLVSKSLLPQIALGSDDGGAAFARELVAAGLWVEGDDEYVIPSWLNHNRTAAEQEKLSEIRAEAGRRGGRVSPKQTASNLLDDGGSKRSSTSQAEKSREQKSRGGEARARTRPPSRVPEPFEVTDPMAAWATEHHPSVAWRDETAKFLDHYRANGATRADWIATWRNWIRRAGEGVR